MSYNFNAIEAKWQKYWREYKTFEAQNPKPREQNIKPPYYVLDMFPYPSGAGLHVGHPLGYIASDIITRYRRHKGYNVLHPMGYDSFGLPAEQYAVQTGQHPAITTETNINRYREQLDKIGFSFDWSREVRTSDPKYYKWTQWIFIQLFESWYDNKEDKARPISELIELFESQGNIEIAAASDQTDVFSANKWKSFSHKKQQEILLSYRLTYLADTEVNWCPGLGTVLANDEIINGVSERGGYPVERKKMKQWNMRITAYAERLLKGLDTIDWTDSLKESQRNWIGKSKGTQINFSLITNTLQAKASNECAQKEQQNSISEFNSENAHLPKKTKESLVANEQGQTIQVFTTRPDTIFGVSFMVLAPEHELVSKITTSEQKVEVNRYVEQSSKRSERERMADKTISGIFTGGYVEHPFTKEPVPIWISDYVLASYGTGAVMAVPAGDERDYRFAKHFGIPIPNIFKDIDISEEAFVEKGDVQLKNSDFLNGLSFKEAIKKVNAAIINEGYGTVQVNYRLRDAVFSRQRYWGEPFPIYYKNHLPYPIPTDRLPLKLPEVEKYLPTEDGEPPLGRAPVWHWDEKNNKVVSVENSKEPPEGVYKLELNTMPGWAGSSWYFFRYMEKEHRDNAFATPESLNYWKDVDLYIGGSEHATGHLLYSRFWSKFLKDRGYTQVEEPFKKLINQGMILGESAFVYRVKGENKLISAHQINGKEVDPIHADVALVNTSNELDIQGFKKWRPEFEDAEFITEASGEFIVGREVEKMSKSKYNVVNPDDICTEYGADSLRLYEMFLGPIDQEKPWSTAGLSGVYGFLKKFWNLYHSNTTSTEKFNVSDKKASQESLKTLHKTIKKVTEDIESFSFNTAVSNFMICVNELSQQKCSSREVLEPLLVLLSPYAPHVAEELWQKLGHNESISTAPYPIYDEHLTKETTKTYPISFNGKKRYTLDLSLDLSKEEIEEIVMADERTQEQLNGRTPKRIIIVPGKIVNIVG